MKKTKITAAILSLAILTACKSGQPVQTSATVSETETSAVTTSATTAATTAATTETETEKETVPETEPAETAEEKEIEYVQVSANNKFIDFEFIENYQGTTDIGDLADKAVEFLKTTECYDYVIKEADDYNEENSPPVLSEAFPADYDGDGRTETFIVIDIPYKNSVTCSFLVFADSNCNMAVMNYYLGTTVEYEFINYGRSKQLIMGCYGYHGAATHTEIYGMRDGKAVELYGGRIGFAKQDCFLSASGWQGSGAFMYFDTVALEYRAITGERIPNEEISAMDTTEVIPKYLDANGYYDIVELNTTIRFYLIGKKYYWLDYPFMGSGELFTYENGVFVPVEDTYIRLSNPEIHDLPLVADIDYDKAIAEMQPPAEPYVQVSEGNEFIDYEFIEDYQGTTDIGDLAGKAVEFFKTTDKYAQNIKNISEFSDEEFPDYIADGVIVPKFDIAYPNDYDGDGKTETFIIVSMPTPPHLRYCLIFCGSSGEMQLIDTFGCWFETSLLDYGKYKHLIVGSFGVNGADSHYSLFGVKNSGGVIHYSGRVEYVKENCFLSTFGWQGSGDFMYFDTGANEYRIIQGKEVSKDEVKKMDADGVLDDLWNDWDWFVRTPNIELIGGKYYCFNYGMMTTGKIYTYENGKFVEQEKSNIRNSWYEYGRTVVDIDIEKAVAEMKKPQK